MYISHLQVGNYKSFRDSAPLELTEGFNIIAGQNNSGKTALLEAIGLNFVAKPHRSMKTVPARDTMPDQVSRVNVCFTLSSIEVKELLLSFSPGARFDIVQPDSGSEYAKRVGFRDGSATSVQNLIDAIFSEKRLTFKLRLQATAGQQAAWVVFDVPTYGLYQAYQPNGQYIHSMFGIERNGKLSATGQDQVGRPSDFGSVLAPVLQRHVYRFAAERMNVGRGSHGGGTVLAQDASNLPEVLNQLQHNSARFRELNGQVSAILPQVRWASVRATSQGQVEIVVWPHEPESKREDLAVPLSESGTGIGQVLAILYVLMTSDRPQAIIIDEPQSFLHPGAARKLIEFLKHYSQHQFIIATHSPTIIAAANPKTITLVRLEDTESVLQQLDAEAEEGIQTTLGELGIRLSDSFGADNILWVEGRTEEKCFPLIVEKMLSRPLMGTEILGIRQTGDLESRDARRVFEIYRSLTGGASLLPPAIAFVLDSECRDDATKQELFKLSGKLAQFLSRRMYENYLLNPAAIAEVLNSADESRTQPVTRDDVHVAIESRLEDPRYYCAPEQAQAGDRVRMVDAARVLEELFNEFSETRVAYEKVRHGVALTRWLTANAPEDLGEVAELLGRILDGGAAARAARGGA